MENPSKKQSRVRSILLIISLLGLILTSVFLSRQRVNDIQATSSSFYKDRLVPSGIIVNLTSAIYRKRLLLETFVLTTKKPDTNRITTALNRLNRRVDSLLTDFGRTKLTVREAERLKVLRQQLALYNQLESDLTANRTDSSKGQQALFAGSGTTAFGQIVQTIDELSALQLSVGEELLGESRGQTNSSYVLTAIQIGLVFMIALCLLWHRM